MYHMKYEIKVIKKKKKYSCCHRFTQLEHDSDVLFDNNVCHLAMVSTYPLGVLIPCYQNQTKNDVIIE